MSVYSHQQYWAGRIAALTISPHMAPSGFAKETSTPLGANATFNGSGRRGGSTPAPYNYIRNRFTIQAYSNTDGTLNLQMYEPTLAQWKTIATKAVAAGVPTRLTASGLHWPLSRLFRASFSNGASAQSTFRLYSWSWWNAVGRIPQNRYL